ncbi:MAG: phospholipid carrier-dependent glycosyltransferase [bacterium]|nr:phospholipid carrier-dependent glycosyltransferase [bacterium]
MNALLEIIKEKRKELLYAWILFAIFVVSQYLYRFAHQEEFTLTVALEYIFGFSRYMILPWVLTILLGLSGYVLGRIFLGIVAKDLKYRCDLEETIWAIGTGLGLIALITFFIGLAKLIYSFIFVLLFIFLLVGGFKHLKHLSNVVRKGLRPLNLDLLEWVLFALFVAIVANTFFLTCNPTISYDSLTYHLAAPKFYIREHAIAYHPWIHFNSFPQLQEMLLMLQMMVIKDPGGSLSYFCTLLAAATIYFTGEMYFSKKSGAIAAVLFMLIQEIYQDSKSALVENILIFYTVLLLHGFLAWAETKDRRWLVLMGIGGGLACGVKYFGITTAFFLIILMVVAYYLPRFKWERIETVIEPVVAGQSEDETKNNNNNNTNHKNIIKKNNIKLSPKAIAKETRVLKPVKPLKHPGLVGAIGLVILWTAIIGSPWYIRNIVLFGNPFFPFYENIFGAFKFGTLSQYKVSAAIDHLEMLQYFHYNLTPLRFITSPWDWTFHHNYPWFQSDHPGAVGPFLLALTPVLLFVRKWRKSAILYGLFTLIFYMYWLVGERIQHLRYMATAFPIHCLVIAWGVTDVFNLNKFTSRKKSHIFMLVLLLTFGFSFFYRTTSYQGIGATNIYFTDQSRSVYLTAQLAEFTIIDKVINTQIRKGEEMVAAGEVDAARLVLTKDTIIYGLSCENRRFYVDCMLIGGLFGYANYKEFMDHASTSDELYEYLHSLGCDFLLVNKTVAQRMDYRVDIQLPEDEQFTQRFEEIARMGDVIFYYLAGPGEERHLSGFNVDNEGPSQTEGGETPEYQRIVPEQPEDLLENPTSQPGY